MNIKYLTDAGIDYKAGVERFLDDPELYEAILNAFLNDDLLSRAEAAYESGDRNALRLVIHEAKGSSGNAGFLNIYAAASELSALLRGGNYTDDELRAGFRRFESVYSTVYSGVSAALNG